MNNKKEYIICAAWKRKEPRTMVEKSFPYKPENNDIMKIEIGYRHHDIWERFSEELSIDDGAQGFYTSKGRFVSRLEAMKIAVDCGQVAKKNSVWWKEDENLNQMFYGKTKIKAGDLRPLASEDLYCCSPYGNGLNE